MRFILRVRAAVMVACRRLGTVMDDVVFQPVPMAAVMAFVVGMLAGVKYNEHFEAKLAKLRDMSPQQPVEVATAAPLAVSTSPAASAVPAVKNSQVYLPLGDYRKLLPADVVVSPVTPEESQADAVRRRLRDSLQAGGVFEEIAKGIDDRLANGKNDGFSKEWSRAAWLGHVWAVHLPYPAERYWHDDKWQAAVIDYVANSLESLHTKEELARPIWSIKVRQTVWAEIPQGMMAASTSRLP